MRDEAVETVEHEGLMVKIYHDTDAQSPAEWGDDNLFLVHYHRDFWQENKKVLCENDLRDLYQGNKTETTRELRKKYHIWPVSALIHSGVWLKLGYQGFASDSGGWDTSHVGAVFAAKSEWKTRKQAEKCAEGLVKTWNQYLSGDVYGYVVEDKDGEHLDSCWGYYGIKDALAEGKSMAEYHAKERKQKREAKLKALVKNRVALEKREEVLA